VLVTAVPGAVSAAAIDVVAGTGATVNLSLTVAGGKTAHPALPASDPGKPAPPHPAGITGTTLRVFAGPGSDVNIARMQALDGDFDDIDDMGLFTADSARIHVRQTVLGASRSFTGLAGDLRGDGSRVQVDTHYLGNGSRELDFNYAMRQHGRDTECAMQANGVLAGRSKKVLRGTIDLVRGCKGSAGQENESVLLVDDGVRNVTVPVILCNEDDVSGNHGATIGHVRGEQLFYLGCRGLSPEAAEHLFAEALLEQAALDAADGTAREAVVQLGEKLHPGFRARFDEEA
jgi:Fe-S cluster assembly scaffold protein SufB